MKIFKLFIFSLIFSDINAQNIEILDSKIFFENINKSENIQLLDVRTQDEYKNGAIENALNIDFNNKEKFYDQILFLDKSRPVYIYCYSGGRSSEAAKILQKNGFLSIFDLKGGYRDWEYKREKDKIQNQTITLKKYNNLIEKGNVLVVFSAKWCPPCQKLVPEINVLENQNKEINILRFDVDVEKELCKFLKIDQFPTLINYKNGKEKWKKNRYCTKSEILAEINSKE